MTSVAAVYRHTGRLHRFDIPVPGRVYLCVENGGGVLLEELDVQDIETQWSRICLANGAQVDLATGSVQACGRESRLTRHELALLREFAATPDSPRSSEYLMSKLWDEVPTIGAARTMNVWVCRLRRKLGDDAIETRHGIGYRLLVKEEEGNI